MVDYSKFDFIDDSDDEVSVPVQAQTETAEAVVLNFPIMSTYLSGSDRVDSSPGYVRWKQARAHSTSAAEKHFFEVQDELHMQLFARCCIGQMVGDKGVDARMKQGQQLIQDAICTEELISYAAKWNNPFGDPDEDPHDPCMWSMSAMMRSTELREHVNFPGIMENVTQLEIQKRHAEDQLVNKTMADAEKPMAISCQAARWCMFCKKDPSPHMCSGCSVACYCSQECQKRHWKSHKPICSKLKNAETELHALKDMDGIFRSPVVTLEDKRRAFCCWKQVRTSIEWTGKKAKSHNSSITVGRMAYAFTMNYNGHVTWKNSYKTKEVMNMRLQVPYQEFKEAGFNSEAPWLSDVDACRRD
jgi:hypothetical protein